MNTTLAQIMVMGGSVLALAVFALWVQIRQEKENELPKE